MKHALITGITGQDGSYLAELLLKQGYAVYGTVRRKSSGGYGNAAHLQSEPQMHFLSADLTDLASLIAAVQTAQPDEVYNLAAQSFVAASWRQPVLTAEINALGVTNLLEAVRTVKPDARFYQASTSELFGLVQTVPQNEQTPFYPRSPYGAAKLYGHWITKNYRESFGMYACAGILFNHESERRGAEFVTRKITLAAARIANGMQDCLLLGNLHARRDWGHAQDYVRAMHLMLNQDTPDDYVIASGETHTVREFAALAFAAAGMPLRWTGAGESETGICETDGRAVVRVSPALYRPAEVELLLGDPSKAERVLGWRREIGFAELVQRMVQHDLECTGRQAQSACAS